MKTITMDYDIYEAELSESYEEGREAACITFVDILEMQKLGPSVGMLEEVLDLPNYQEGMIKLLGLEEEFKEYIRDKQGD